MGGFRIILPWGLFDHFCFSSFILCFLSFALQKELLSLEVEIGLLAQQGVSETELKHLGVAKTLLQRVDENLNYEVSYIFLG